jgi:hypothetical protein
MEQQVCISQPFPRHPQSQPQDQATLPTEPH